MPNPTEPACKSTEGCHRVVPCEPGCGTRNLLAEATSPVPPSVATAALADGLRYVLNYRGPGHAHEIPGVWDTSGKPCDHCARLAMARKNLAAYDAQLLPERAKAPTAEQTVRDHVLALHQIGEQLSGLESWMWEHLADTRDAAKEDGRG